MGDSTLIAAAIGVGGTVIVGVAGFWASVRNTNKTTALTLRAVELTEQGQVTDRYSKAIEQLGSDKLDVRIGGIYAVERIARDSPRDHPTIMEVLVAFIREHSPERWQPPEDKAETPDWPMRPDVQAAATVIGRRTVRNDSHQINLAHAWLRGADFTGARLGGADLTGANLAGARFFAANLGGANLSAANLDGADLYAAYLDSANLDGANLAHASLRGANLTGAFLGHARLDSANLDGAIWPRTTEFPDSHFGRYHTDRHPGDAAQYIARCRAEHGLHAAARTAAVMRGNLQARHGGISEAVSDAQARVAERDFYTHDES
jgi:Pentapeptide repeats (8 copies)